MFIYVSDILSEQPYVSKEDKFDGRRKPQKHSQGARAETVSVSGEGRRSQDCYHEVGEIRQQFFH